MTPILINLLVEEQRAEHARARDPVKLLIAISLALMAVVVAVGGLLSGLVMRSRATMEVVESQARELEKQQTAGSVGAYRSLKRWADDLIEINQSRRLSAPQLALLKDIVPDYIQLVRLSLVTSVAAQTPAAPPPEGMDDIKAKIARRQAPATESLGLQLEGKVVSAHPEEDLASFQHSLEANTAFSAQIQQVKLRSYSRQSAPTERGGAIVGQFVIECLYREHL